MLVIFFIRNLLLPQRVCCYFAFVFCSMNIISTILLIQDTLVNRCRHDTVFNSLMSFHQAKCHFHIAPSICTSLQSQNCITTSFSVFFGIWVAQILYYQVLNSLCFQYLSRLWQLFYTMLFCWTTLLHNFSTTVIYNIILWYDPIIIITSFL